MGDEENYICFLQQRNSQLEDRIEALRMSRRILIQLIDRLEQEKRLSVTTLERENDRLRKANRKFAIAMMKLQARLVLLEKKQDFFCHLLDNT